MKIAQIAPPWISIPPKNYGGTESVIYNLIEELVTQGHDVTLYAPGDARTSARQVSFFRRSLLAEKVPWDAHLKAYYHLHKALGQAGADNFDIVHTHLSVTTDMYVFPLTARLSVPHVTTLHSHFPFDHITDGWEGDADNYFMEWAPSVPVVALSESARREVRLPLNFVGVVYNGLPIQDYEPTRQPREDFFIWFGRFAPEKGAHLAIEAAHKAHVPLILAGTLDRSNQEAVDYFHKTVEPGIDGQQIRYIGPLDLEQKVDYLDRARGFLNPIMWAEPFGLVMVEALAMGCPVISFANGAASEIIEHGKHGFLVNDVDEMVQYIPLIDKIDRAPLHAYVDAHFSARKMAQRYVEIYQQVIEQKRR